MDFAKEINSVVRKSISESLCNELADKIQKLVEEKFTSTNSAIVSALKVYQEYHSEQLSSKKYMLFQDWCEERLNLVKSVEIL